MDKAHSRRKMVLGTIIALVVLVVLMGVLGYFVHIWLALVPLYLFLALLFSFFDNLKETKGRGEVEVELVGD